LLFLCGTRKSLDESSAMFDQPRVRLMHYDARWRQEFQQTRSSILFSCDGWVSAVEHIGSTAVSGLISRPTIDVVAGVEDRQALDEATPRIEGLNYRRVQAPEWAQNATVLVKPRHSVAGQPDPTHSILLTVTGSGTWRKVLRMRDFLREHPETAIRFEEAKVAHWRSGEGDLENYQAAKALFFSHLEDQLDATEGG
jgi:GrpB-like predicted nucleotidyltransferase (UPF0157 family)